MPISGPPFEPAGLRRRDLLAGAVGTASLVGGCSGGYNLKYRFTVDLLVEGRRVSESAIRTFGFHEGHAWAQGLDVGRYQTSGDAVVVDLGRRGLLIATLAAWAFDPTQKIWYVDADPWIPFGPYLRTFGGYGPNWRRSSGNAVVLKPSEYPLLVTFADPTRPTTVREVDPQNLAATFGAGVALECMTVTPSHGLMTTGIVERRLPWVRTLVSYKTLGGGLNGASHALLDNLNPRHFTTRADRSDPNPFRHF
jgi:hypothetical protein